MQQAKDIVPAATTQKTAAEKELNYVMNYSIKQITHDLEEFSFNTAVARMMEFVNAIYKYNNSNADPAFLRQAIRTLVLLLAPFTPHMAEEFWEMLGEKYSVFNERYPVCDEAALIKDEIEYAIQINSKLKTKAMIASDRTNEEIEADVRALPELQDALAGKTIKKCIVVKGRLVNLIVQ